jgi:hypothetical protein
VNTTCVSGAATTTGRAGASVHCGIPTAHTQSVYARRQSPHPVTNEYRPLVSLLHGYVDTTVRKFARCTLTVWLYMSIKLLVVCKGDEGTAYATERQNGRSCTRRQFLAKKNKNSIKDCQYEKKNYA